MSKSAKKVVSQVSFEIGQIDELLDRYSDLLSRVLEREPDEVEIAAVASVIHSFYSGIESVFLAVAKSVDERIPSGPRWHSDLLLQMTRSTTPRGQVVSTELAARLSDYLAFRHFYRHAYSFLLRWADLRKLVVALHDVWAGTKTELLAFADQLGSDQDGAG